MSRAGFLLLGIITSEKNSLFQRLVSTLWKQYCFSTMNTIKQVTFSAGSWRVFSGQSLGDLPSLRNLKVGHDDNGPMFSFKRVAMVMESFYNTRNPNEDSQFLYYHELQGPFPNSSFPCPFLPSNTSFLCRAFTKSLGLLLWYLLVYDHQPNGHHQPKHSTLSWLWQLVKSGIHH